jgi:transcriptional regulator with XRE-family HTH domain
MEPTSEILPIPDREIFYQRERQRNRVFEALVGFYANRAEKSGISQRDIAKKLKRDPAQISRWLSQPSNLTLDTVTDLLLALDAELDVTVHLFADRPKTNYVHPWLENFWQQGEPRVFSMPSGSVTSASNIQIAGHSAAQTGTNRSISLSE